MRHKDYEAFMRSPSWQEKKRLFRITRDWPICFKCGAWDVPMDVHHLTYARFGGHELMEDLEYVCRPCHNEIHKASIIRRMVSREKAKHPPTAKSLRRKRYKAKRKDRKANAVGRMTKYERGKQ